MVSPENVESEDGPVLICPTFELDPRVLNGDIQQIADKSFT